MVHPSDLGFFKLEHEVEEGIFLSDKFYGLKTRKLDKDGNPIFVIRCKGIPRSNVNWDILKDLYKSGDVFKTKKLSSFRNIKEGTVVIKNSGISLSLKYKKRKKIFDNNL